MTKNKSVFLHFFENICVIQKKTVSLQADTPNIYYIGPARGL